MTPAAETFRDKVCRRFAVPPECYDEIMLKLTLYPHARWLVPFATVEFLEPDRTFIAGVGQLTRWRGFSGEVRDFQHDARNRRFARRVLRLRVSVGRMRVLFSKIWDKAAPPAEEHALRPSMPDPSSFLIS